MEESPNLFNTDREMHSLYIDDKGNEVDINSAPNYGSNKTERDLKIRKTIVDMQKEEIFKSYNIGIVSQSNTSSKAIEYMNDENFAIVDSIPDTTATIDTRNFTIDRRSRQEIRHPFKKKRCKRKYHKK